MDIIVSHTPPKAAFNITPYPLVNLTTSSQITFTDSSIPGNGNITAVIWNFGDGTTSNQTIVNHTYIHSGIYIVTLTVIDDNGEVDTTDKITIEIN